MGESSPNLLRPADEGPIASPPPRPSSRSGQSTPSPTKVPLLPIVATTARTEENGHTQRRQSVRADSPMPGPPTGQPILRKGVFLHEDSVLDGNNKLQGSDIEDLDSQIREIQQNTDDILENIEDEIFGDDVEMPYVTNPTVTKCENQGTFPYENVQSNARVPPGGTFEKDMFVDKEGFLPLGRQLPPTRSTHNRRASVPREHALRNKQRKFLSRTTVPDVRGPSMPGAFGVPERIREQVQRRLNTTHAATTHGSHTNRQTRSESDHWTAEQPVSSLLLLYYRGDHSFEASVPCVLPLTAVGKKQFAGGAWQYNPISAVAEV